MDTNPYAYTPAADRDVTASPRPRTPRSGTQLVTQIVHLVVMCCQLGFWIWIVYDQQTQWKQSTLLLVFFSTMVTLFGIGVICDTLCLFRILRNADGYISAVSLVVCILLGVLMMGSHASFIIFAWLAFSALWACACLARLKVFSTEQSAKSQLASP